MQQRFILDRILWACSPQKIPARACGLLEIVTRASQLALGPTIAASPVLLASDALTVDGLIGAPSPHLDMSRNYTTIVS